VCVDRGTAITDTGDDFGEPQNASGQLVAIRWGRGVADGMIGYCVGHKTIPEKIKPLSVSIFVQVTIFNNDAGSWVLIPE
jgi:hypothetical protein